MFSPEIGKSSRIFKIFKNWKILKNPPGPEFFKSAPEKILSEISKKSRTGPARPGPRFPGICRKVKIVISGSANVSPATFFEAEKPEIRKPKVRGKDFLPSGRRPYTFLLQTRFWAPFWPLPSPANPLWQLPFFTFFLAGFRKTPLCATF